jgi:hypothetical protein
MQWRLAMANGDGRRWVLDFAHRLHQEVTCEAANSTGVARSTKTRRRWRVARRSGAARQRKYGELDLMTRASRTQTSNTNGNLTSKRNSYTASQRRGSDDGEG